MNESSVIYKVLTVEEIAQLWGKNPTTIRRAMDSKKKPLTGRKSCKVWLIDVESVVRRWGSPKMPVS